MLQHKEHSQAWYNVAAFISGAKIDNEFFRKHIRNTGAVSIGDNDEIDDEWAKRVVDDAVRIIGEIDNV